MQENTKDIEHSFPLSPMQQGMLFHRLVDKDSGVDIEQVVCSLPEPIHVPALRKAWDQVLRRHENLRVYFQWEDVDEPVQHVQRGVRVPFELHDMSNRSSEAQQKTLDAYLKADRVRGFSLGKAPLMRLTLWRCGDADFCLVWSFHHIIADGRSQIVVLREVFSFYEALCEGRFLTLADPPQHRDFVHWLGRAHSSGREVFWKKYLEGITAPTPLVVDKRQTAAPGDQHARKEQQMALSPELLGALRRLAKENDVTLNTLVQGVWSLLLHRYSGQEHIVFGAVRAGRSWSREAYWMVGLTMNTVPVCVRVSPEMSLLPWLRALREQQIRVRDFEHTPLVQIQGWSDVPRGLPLFESILIFDYGTLNFFVQAEGDPGANRDFQLIENTGFPLTLYAYEKPALVLKVAYEQARFDDDAIGRMLGHLRTLLESMVRRPHGRLGELTLLTEAEQHQLLVEWNRTDRDVPGDTCIHELFEAQARRTPEAVAVVFDDLELTYAELNTRANQLARRLRTLGVGPEVPVGIFMERSLEMMVALLGILKAGGAYVPLDPSYPRERLAFMISDSTLAVIVVQSALAQHLPAHHATVVEVDSTFESLLDEPGEEVDSGVTPANLAYIMYTSGSTGKPKGVMICHRNVINFFAGMDECVDHDDASPGVWMAVTSMSFDISVLELFWTLVHGFKVVLQPDEHFSTARRPSASRKLEFSLFYFASEEGGGRGEPYRLVLEGARFADKHGFAAVWTPERHFHAFGGLYPNPSVISAAIAAITDRVHIRAGSVVLPLHNPIRVAEEWAVVDNLSGGRVAISFASGWQPNDFILAPQNHSGRKEIMFRDVEIVRQLWRGEKVAFDAVDGKKVEVHILPRPVQSELPFWITAGGSPDTFQAAGAVGANLLTHLLGQSLDQLAEKIQVYREAFRRQSGGKGEGHVTLMLHTFLGRDRDAVREKVREPFSRYLKTALDLVRLAPTAFPNFSRRADASVAHQGDGVRAEDFTEADMDALVQHAFDRYFETHGLFGTPETCLEMLDRLQAIGVDEIACLIDFGVDDASVLESLTYLHRLKEQSNTTRRSLPEQFERHKVTHMQCTPTMAKALTLDQDALQSLQTLRNLLLGGEALPKSLADEIGTGFSGRFLNMYGPTETTIWSTTATVGQGADRLSIGKPIANTQIYILDHNRQPVPVGVPGELYIGGAGVARGYLQRPELTAEKFIRNPFAGQLDARLYRTGDEARYLADGRIEFVGRLDDQVKIRGHRIELGEVEVAFEKLPSVRQAVVVAREDAHGEQRLVAYLTTQSSRPTVDELRKSLRATLPEFMVPAAFVMLTTFPLTPNGKINRPALPAPDTDRPDLQKSYVAPRNDRERWLAEIWRQVLGIERIGVHDNFFDLGGDSILAIQIVAKANRANVHVTVRQVLDHQTIAELAEVCRPGETVKEQGGLVTGPVVLTPMQQWLLEKDLPDHCNQTVLLKVPANLDSGRLEEALRYLMGHHDALRMRFQRMDAGWRQVNASFDGSVPFSRVDLAQAMLGEQAARLNAAIEEMQTSVSLSAGPVFKAVHFTCGEDRPGRLLLIGHRLVIDDVSWRIVLEDLQNAYQQVGQGKSIQLPPKTTSFQDWAATLRESARRDSVVSKAATWAALVDYPMPQLPLDHADGVNLEAAAGSITTSLSVEETARLLTKVPSAYGTRVHETLLTALLQATSRWVKDTKLLVDLQEPGRVPLSPTADVSRTVGCFTTLFPVLVDLGSADSLGNQLKSVKEQVRKRSNDGMVYGLARFLSDNKALRERLHAAPQAEILFAYLGEFAAFSSDSSFFEPASELPGPFSLTANPRRHRPYLLEVFATVVEEKLNVIWRHSETVHKRSTIEKLSDDFMTSSRSIIEHCSAKRQREYTPTDFPMANLGQQELDALAAMLERSGQGNGHRASEEK